MNPCPSDTCSQLAAVCVTCLALSWLLWFPYAVREKRIPSKVAWAASVAATVAVLVAALFMPYACQPCGGLR
jgi:hypothetical protein